MKKKLSNEFKDEVKQEFKEFDYVWARIGLRILIVALIVGVIASAGGIAYKKWRVDQGNEIFKESVAYNEGAAAFLADRYQEYNEAETAMEQKMIMEYVVMRYPNLDDGEIDNAKLRQFYNQCLIGGK